jgi:drug/metabolite transporter (DMT)-like permease
MPLTALLLIAVAAFIHAWWNLLMKRAGAGGLVFVWGITAATALVYAVPVLGLMRDELGAFGASLGLAVLVSAAVHTLYLWVLQRGYAVGDLSVVYPVARGVGPALAWIGAVVLLGEAVTPGSIAGLALIVAGTFTIAGGWAMLRARAGAATRAGASAGTGVGAAADANPHADARAPANPAARLGPGIAWGAAIGVTIAVYTVNDGRAVRLLRADPVVFYWLVNVAQALALAPWVARRAGEARTIVARHARTLLAVGVLSPLGYMLALQAMKYAPVSHVAPARELSMLVAAFLGVRVLGEGELWRRVAGAALIAAGVASLALAGGG